ncbi:MAG: glycerophosphodiester phosphodiesterase [Nitratireductor sp.]|nr:glycerophosphodiester phosphodiesterase [Nitratireductor sp.]
MPKKTDWIAASPIAHRALHDVRAGRPENSLAAAAAAVTQGFHIEVDLQPSRDRVPMVFHDYTLERMAGTKGNVRDLTAEELGRLALCGTDERVPTLAQLLETVAGKSGIVLELKGLAGQDEGFVAEVAKVLAGYDGPVAIMSFNHWLLADARRDAPHLVLGLTAEGDDSHYGEHVAALRAHDPEFVSYGIEDLPCRFVAEFRENTKRPVITWTIRSPQDAAKSALYADQITFEGFDPR